MDTLSLRIKPEDDENLEVLCRSWGLSRSAAARKAIEDTAVRLRKKRRSKMDILKDHSLIGCYADEKQKSSKSALKESLKKKYGR